MENKNLKKYLSLSLGVANVLSPMAIATLTGNLTSLTVNAGAGSESEEERPRAESRLEEVQLSSGSMIGLNNATGTFDFVQWVPDYITERGTTIKGLVFDDVRAEDFECGGLRLVANRQGGADLLFKHNGKKYKYIGKNFGYNDGKNDYYFNLSKLIFESETFTEGETFTLEGVEFRLSRREVVQLPSGAKIELNHVASEFTRYEREVPWKQEDFNNALAFDLDYDNEAVTGLTYTNPNSGEEYKYDDFYFEFIDDNDEWHRIEHKKLTFDPDIIEISPFYSLVKIGGVTFSK